MASDPDELSDLAGDPSRGTDLARLREELRRWMQATRDTGILPEPILRREARAAGSEWAIFHPQPEGEAAAAARYEELLSAAWEAGEDRPVAQFVAGLGHSDPAIRYWRACGTGWSGSKPGTSPAARAAAIAALERLVKADADVTVRDVAATWLDACRQPEGSLR